MHRKLGIFLWVRDTNTGDVEELQGVVVERSDATVLLVIKSGSVQKKKKKEWVSPSVGSLHRKWAVGLTSNLVGWFGKVHSSGGECLWSTV